MKIGNFVGREILEERADDGAADAQGVLPLFEGEDLNLIAEDDTRYIWRPVSDSPLGFNGLLPGWNGVTPFGVDSLEEFLPEAYPEFGSEQYAQEIEEIRRIGGAENTALTTIERTADQEELVLFWLVDDPDTERPPGQWLRIGQESRLRKENP
ncbi:MAG: hypothetical protein HC890_09650 [Chloroflexaceae bacterium]|nr:hypothetical protein [Chloroflexaceae bacterium]